MHLNFIKKPYILTLTGILFFLLSTKAQTIPLDAKVCTGKLANGFTYYIRHNQEPKWKNPIRRNFQLGPKQLLNQFRSF